MAQEANRSQGPMLCTMGCGFYGNPRTDGMCSVCYKEHLQRQNASDRQSPTGKCSFAIMLVSYLGLTHFLAHWDHNFFWQTIWYFDMQIFPKEWQRKAKDNTWFYWTGWNGTSSMLKLQGVLSLIFGDVWSCFTGIRRNIGCNDGGWGGCTGCISCS